MRKKNKDFDLHRTAIRRIITQQYVSSGEEKIAQLIYNYGFWKAFSIALIIGIIFGGIIFS